MAKAPDSLVVTGPAFLQTAADQLLVTLTGGVQMTLASALSAGGFSLALQGTTTYATDAAAAAGGVAIGQLYRNGSVVQVRIS